MPATAVEPPTLQRRSALAGLRQNGYPEGKNGRGARCEVLDWAVGRRPTNGHPVALSDAADVVLEDTAVGGGLADEERSRKERGGDELHDCKFCGVREWRLRRCLECSR